MRINAFHLSTVTLTIMMLFCLSAFAAEERVADHAALRALRDKAADAINRQDMPTLATCLADEFAFTTIDQMLTTNKAQLVAHYDRMLKGPDAILTSMKTEPKADVPTRFLGDNAGYCFGTAIETYTLKNGVVSVWTNRWTALVVKQNGEWKAAAVHAGANFLDNPLLTRVEAGGKKLAIGAALIGLLVGLVLGRVLFARKPSAAT
jgi:ketosteroid isomerase-like protein